MEKPITEYLPVTNGDYEPCVIHVARNGTDLVNIKLTEVRAWLLSGELTRTDHYFNPEMQQWRMLDSHPDLADPAGYKSSPNEQA
jgi:hypothetical protein